MEARIGRGAAAWAGIAAAIAGAGAGEILAALVAPRSSPFAAIGSALIDAAPTWAKDVAIAVFGTNDKLALLVLIAIMLLAVAVAAGLVQRARPPWGAVGAGILGFVGAAAAITRADADALAALPSVLAGVIGSVGVWIFVRPTTADPAAAVTPSAGATASLSRRGFVLGSVGAAVIGAGAVAWAATGRTASASVRAIRDGLRLPTAARIANVPAGADLGIDGLAPYLTPNRDFYRIDTALIVPEIDPADWSLRIHGLVDRELTLTWDDLLALPLEESVTTLACVSNPVGGDLVGTARWLGYPIHHLLTDAGVQGSADMVLSRSHDGFTAGTPLEALTDGRNAILAVGMNGEPLPIQHGFPVRMVVPGLYGYVSATKWVVDLEVTRFDQARAYWTDRGWSARGPIKLQSRIDVPRSTDIAAGETIVAGIAWQPHTGIAGVEVRVDEGTWQRAELARATSDDTWVQWSLPIDIPPGAHTLTCRALSRRGQTQSATQLPPAPDGAQGWHSVGVTAA